MPGWGGFVGEAASEVVDHGDGDHAGGVAGQGFVVSGEAAVLHEPTEGAFDDPAALHHAEPFDLRVLGDDLDVDAERGTVFDGCDLESGIDPGLVRVGWIVAAWSSRSLPITLSLTLAAVTITASSRPRVSVIMPRLPPTIFLPASIPCVSAGTLVDVFTLCVSMIDAVGSTARPGGSRPSPG